MSNSQYRENKYSNRPGTGLVSLGAPKRTKSIAKLAVPKPVNLPSIKKENAGNDPNSQLLPATYSGWTAKVDDQDTDSASIVERSTWASGESRQQQLSTSASWQRSGALNPADFPSLTVSASGKPSLPAPLTSQQRCSSPCQENVWDEDERGHSFSKLEKCVGSTSQSRRFASHVERTTLEKGAGFSTAGDFHQQRRSSRIGFQESLAQFGSVGASLDRRDFYHQQEDRYSSQLDEERLQHDFSSRQERPPAAPWHSGPSGSRWGHEPKSRLHHDFMDNSSRSFHSNARLDGTRAYETSKSTKLYDAPLATDYDPGLFPPMPVRQSTSGNQQPERSDHDEEREAFNAELERVAAQLQQKRQMVLADMHSSSDPSELEKATRRLEHGLTENLRLQSAWGYASNDCNNSLSELMSTQESPSRSARECSTHGIHEHDQRKAKELAEAQAAAHAALSRPPPPGAEPAFERRPAPATDRKGDSHQQVSPMTFVPPPPPPPHPKLVPAHDSFIESTDSNAAIVDLQDQAVGTDKEYLCLPKGVQSANLNNENKQLLSASDIASQYELAVHVVESTAEMQSPPAPAPNLVKPGASWRSVLSGLPDTLSVVPVGEQQGLASAAEKKVAKDVKRFKGKSGKVQQAAGVIYCDQATSELGDRAAKSRCKSGKEQGIGQNSKDFAGIVNSIEQRQPAPSHDASDGSGNQRQTLQLEYAVRGTHDGVSQGRMKGESGGFTQIATSASVVASISLQCPLQQQGNPAPGQVDSGDQLSTSDVQDAVGLGSQLSSAAAFEWSSPLADEVAKLQLTAAASNDKVQQGCNAPDGHQVSGKEHDHGMQLVDQQSKISANIHPGKAAPAANSSSCYHLHTAASHSPNMHLLGDDVITALPADLSLDLTEDAAIKRDEACGFEPSMSTGFEMLQVQPVETIASFPGGLFATPSVCGLSLWQHSPAVQEPSSSPSLAAAAQSLYTLSQQQPHFTFGTHTNIPLPDNQTHLLPAVEQQQKYTSFTTNSAFVPTGKQPDWSTPHARTGSPIPLPAYNTFMSQHEQPLKQGDSVLQFKSSTDSGDCTQSRPLPSPSSHNVKHLQADGSKHALPAGNQSRSNAVGRERKAYDPAAALPDDVFDEVPSIPTISSIALQPGHLPSCSTGGPSLGTARQSDRQVLPGKPARFRLDGKSSVHAHQSQMYENGVAFGSIYGNKAPPSGYAGANTSRGNMVGQGQGRHVHGMHANAGNGMLNFPPPPPPPPEGTVNHNGRGGRMRAGRGGRGAEYTKSMYVPKGVAGFVHGSKDVCS